MNIVVDQLLLEPKLLTAYLDPITELVNLKQEQNIVFIDFLVIITNELVDGRDEGLLVGLDHGLFLRHLLGVEVVLEEAVVQVDGGQLLDFL